MDKVPPGQVSSESFGSGLSLHSTNAIDSATHLGVGQRRSIIKVKKHHAV